jgi:hypothetical protein
MGVTQSGLNLVDLHPKKLILRRKPGFKQFHTVKNTL